MPGFEGIGYGCFSRVPSHSWDVIVGKQFAMRNSGEFKSTLCVWSVFISYEKGKLMNLSLMLPFAVDVNLFC